MENQLVKCLVNNGLLPDLQSAYGANHSTETAVLKVLANMRPQTDGVDSSQILR